MSRAASRPPLFFIWTTNAVCSLECGSGKLRVTGTGASEKVWLANNGATRTRRIFVQTRGISEQFFRRRGQTIKDQHMQFETLATGYGLLEGPRTDDQNRLYFSDIRNGGVLRRSPDGKIETLIPERKS